MAAYVVLLHLVLIAALVAALRGTAEPDGFRREMLGHLARLDRNIGDGAVLFLGSSSVQGLHVADVAANAANLGLGGERIGELHARIAGYTSLARARLAVLAIGYNDLRAGPPEAALDAYRALLAGLPAGLKLVISGVQPGAARDALPAATDAFNTGLRALCAQRAGCAYVDLAGLVGDAYEADGVHLSAAVYSSWKQALRQAIAGLDPPPARVGR